MIVLLIRTTDYGLEIFKVAARLGLDDELIINTFLSEHAARAFIGRRYKGAIVREYNM